MSADLQDGWKLETIGPVSVEIPADWDMVTLNDVSDNSGQYGANESAQEFDKKGFRYIRITDISEDGLLKNGDKQSIPIEGNEKYRLEKGDLLFARTGSVGRSYLYSEDDSDVPCAFAGYLIRYKINENINMEYLKQYTNSIYFNKWVNSIARSTTHANINASEYSGLDIPYPPLPEQRRIADILSTVDEEIQQTNKIIEKATEIRKGVLNDLLSKGINESQLEEVQFGPIERTIPTSWEVVELNDITERLTNGISESQNTEGNGFPVTRIETIANGKVNLSKVGWVDDDPSEYEDYRIRENDILFSHINSLDHVGKAAQYRENEGTLYHGMNLLLLRFDWDLIHPRFAYICITAPYFRKLCRSFAKKAVNQVSLNQSDVGSLPLLLPGYNEQEMIAQRIECIDRKLRLERQQKRYLKDLKRGLMQDILTGKVRVSTD